MKRALRLCVLSVVAAATLWLAASPPASAGGWAVTTLDPLPAIEPGEEATVGFTIRQHGVTPVALDDVSVMLFVEGGVTERLLARPEGALGHYVVDLLVPQGTHRWEVHQGWFGPQDLGPLVVTGGALATPPPAAGEGRWPAAARYGLLALTAVSAAVFVASLAWRPRREHPAATAA